MLPMWVSGLFLGRSAGQTASPPPQLDVAIDVLSVVYDPRNVRSVTGDSEASSPITAIGLSQFTLSNHRDVVDVRVPPSRPHTLLGARQRTHNVRVRTGGFEPKAPDGRVDGSAVKAEASLLKPQVDC